MKMDETHRPDPAEEQDDRILTELLSRHKDFLFAQDPQALGENELAQSVEKLMEITRVVRPAATAEKEKQDKWAWIPFKISPPLLALAASLVLIFGGLVWIGVHKAGPVMSGVEPGTAPAEPEMVLAARVEDSNPLGLSVPGDRPSAPEIAASGAALGSYVNVPGLNVLGLIVTRVRSMMTPAPLFIRDYPPVAYLFTGDTNVVLLRADGAMTTTQRVATTAFALFKGDKILAFSDAQSFVVHPDRVTSLTGPGRFRLDENGIVFDLSEEKQRPGIVLSGVLSPEALLSEAEAVPEPMQDAEWVVLSPVGNTLSATPPLVWMSREGNDDEGACEVSLESVDGSGGNSIGPVAVIGGRLDWSQTGWDPLPRGSSWRVVLRSEGRLVSDPGFIFHVLSDEEAQGLDARFKDVRALLGENRPASLFAQASVLLLYQPACAAEARLISQQLRADAKENILYLCLMRRAYAEMGLPEQAQEVSGYIRNLLNAHHSAE